MGSMTTILCIVYVMNICPDGSLCPYSLVFSVPFFLHMVQWTHALNIFQKMKHKQAVSLWDNQHPKPSGRSVKVRGRYAEGGTGLWRANSSQRDYWLALSTCHNLESSEKRVSMEGFPRSGWSVRMFVRNCFGC